jgi:hypothetical protein
LGRWEHVNDAQPNQSEAAGHLRQAATELQDADAQLKNAAGKVSPGDDKTEAELLAEETRDVRTRVKALAERIAPSS